jgi:hypothetical protein
MHIHMHKKIFLGEVKIMRMNFVLSFCVFFCLICRVLSGSPSTDALLRTTTAVTRFNAGIKVRQLGNILLKVTLCDHVLTCDGLL